MGASYLCFHIQLYYHFQVWSLMLNAIYLLIFAFYPQFSKKCIPPPYRTQKPEKPQRKKKKIMQQEERDVALCSWINQVCRDLQFEQPTRNSAKQNLELPSFCFRPQPMSLGKLQKSEACIKFEVSTFLLIQDMLSIASHFKNEISVYYIK